MTTKKRRLGRPTIFPGKVTDDGTLKPGGDRVQGVLTPLGSLRFEEARRQLAKLADMEVEQVSDSDTIEALSRGWAATKAHLRERRAELAKA